MQSAGTSQTHQGCNQRARPKLISATKLIRATGRSHGPRRVADLISGNHWSSERRVGATDHAELPILLNSGLQSRSITWTQYVSVRYA